MNGRTTKFLNALFYTINERDLCNMSLPSSLPPISTRTDSRDDSLSHVRWDCKYHVVFIPKYRPARSQRIFDQEPFFLPAAFSPV